MNMHLKLFIIVVLTLLSCQLLQASIKEEYERFVGKVDKIVAVPKFRVELDLLMMDVQNFILSAFLKNDLKNQEVLLKESLFDLYEAFAHFQKYFRMNWLTVFSLYTSQDYGRFVILTKSLNPFVRDLGTCTGPEPLENEAVFFLKGLEEVGKYYPNLWTLTYFLTLFKKYPGLNPNNFVAYFNERTFDVIPLRDLVLQDTPMKMLNAINNTLVPFPLLDGYLKRSNQVPNDPRHLCMSYLIRMSKMYPKSINHQLFCEVLSSMYYIAPKSMDFAKLYRDLDKAWPFKNLIPTNEVAPLVTFHEILKISKEIIQFALQRKVSFEKLPKHIQKEAFRLLNFTNFQQKDLVKGTTKESLINEILFTQFFGKDFGFIWDGKDMKKYYDMFDLSELMKIQGLRINKAYKQFMNNVVLLKWISVNVKDVTMTPNAYTWATSKPAEEIASLLFPTLKKLMKTGDQQQSWAQTWPLILFCSRNIPIDKLSKLIEEFDVTLQCIMIGYHLAETVVNDMYPVTTSEYLEAPLKESFTMPLFIESPSKILEMWKKIKVGENAQTIVLALYDRMNSDFRMKVYLTYPYLESRTSVKENNQIIFEKRNELMRDRLMQQFQVTPIFEGINNELIDEGFAISSLSMSIFSFILICLF